MKINEFRFDGKKKFVFKDFDTKRGNSDEKEEIIKNEEKNLLKMKEFQDKFYAQNNEALLIIFQAMDAGGKDGAIKHVISGMNPQGIDVHNFKQPTSKELSHGYLWRAFNVLPRKGKIGIFNRSYYEDVLIAKVHNLIKNQNLPKRCMHGDIIKQRYEQIENFEKYLWQNGTRVIKFFLCISKEEQKERFLKRIDDTRKNWKFSESDMKEREFWDDYMKAFQAAINATSKEHAPWYVVPADKKWFARAVISEILLETFKDIDPKYPEFPKEKIKYLQLHKEKLLSEKE